MAAPTPAVRAWIERSIASLEQLPPSKGRDCALTVLRQKLEAPDPLFDPHTLDDWLDRRAALEETGRRADMDAFIADWLQKHHPRFRGKGAE